MIIGFTGKMQVGKSTAAKYLEDKFDFKEVSFAGPLLDVTEALLGITIPRDKEGYEAFKKSSYYEVPESWLQNFPGQSKLSGRQILQYVGTDLIRNNCEDFWVFRMKKHIAEHEGDIVISDVRFDNEAQFIKDMGGIVVEIQRDTGIPETGHQSEAGVRFELIDYNTVNNRDLETFFANIEGVLRHSAGETMV